MKSHYLYLIAFVVTAAIGTTAALSLGPVLEQIGAGPSYIDIGVAIIAAVFGYVAIRLLAWSILSYGRGKARIDEKPVSRLVSLLGYVVILFLVLSAFHVNVAGALVGAGFLGIVIGLASQSTLGNLFAGISMMAAKPFAIGDRITFSTWQYGVLPPSYAHRAMLPGYSGLVQAIGMMYTRLKLDDGTSLYVPNGAMNQAVIINYAVSDVIEINVRAELNAKASLASFRRAVAKKVAGNERLSSRIKGRVEISVTDIGISNYGVDVRARSDVEHEGYVRPELSAIVLEVASAYNAKR